MTTATSARPLAWAAATGALPYLMLKVLWLSGSTVGTTDPAFLAEPSIVVLNVVTFGMDALLVGLAFALTHRWGRSLPAWLLLLPVWIGVGFLLPMALAILPATLLTTGAPAAGPLEPWVQPLVYGGFAWQGGFLMIAFALYARGRWAVATAAAAPGELVRVVAGGGTVMAALSAALHLAAGLAGSPAALVVEGTHAVLAVAGAAGVLALLRGTDRRWLAAGAAFAGSASMFAWGLWGAVLTMTGAVLAAPDPVAGSAQLTGLLGGFALAVAGLLALTRSAPARTPSTDRRS